MPSWIGDFLGLIVAPIIVVVVILYIRRMDVVKFLKNWSDCIPILRSHQKLRRLAKYILSAFIIYMIVKAPIMLLLTDIFGIHYVWSGFIAGAVLTLLTFIPSEYWIWKKHK